MGASDGGASTAVIPYVVAGPSGVGKGTVIRDLLARAPQCWLSVSATTRQPRPGEREGIDYHFVSDAEFDRLIDSGEMLEWAIVHGRNRYGTPRQPVVDMLARGRIPILEVDLDGARQIRRSWPDVEQIFVDAPSWEELVHRLRGRGTEDAAEQERRLETARVERAARDEFDHVVINDSVSGATDQLLRIMGLGQ
ncbi:guanylate kinase [Actinobaculum sp. 352]|uniref:guanylate kinase n=1 Tax=Actinobaculum sp. 352 TaxID=2490946 RepID=UPI000F7EDEBE|nr:guanylate kinase [Actinobaculum sp. 352]RTE48369.1 guanylate kinase [Actinobaculum sp. 352]